MLDCKTARRMVDTVFLPNTEKETYSAILQTANIICIATSSIPYVYNAHTVRMSVLVYESLYSAEICLKAVSRRHYLRPESVQKDDGVEDSSSPEAGWFTSS